MRLAVCSLPLAFLFLASLVTSNAQSVTNTEADVARASSENVILYDVGRKENFTIPCTLPNTKSVNYVWKKNGTLVQDLWDVKDRYKVDKGGAEFSIIGRSQEDDFGHYSCSLEGDINEQIWDVRGRPHSKLPPNTNVVEMQKLKLQCKVIGKPYPKVTWKYSNNTDEEFDVALNGTDVSLVFGDRVKLQPNEQGIENGELVIESAQRTDYGRFACVVTDAPGLNAVTVLRVKDMYAALWPFLGICAEVLVLCAIILIYEKRRGKPEPEDSDTDNHDQKKS